MRSVRQCPTEPGYYWAQLIAPWGLRTSLNDSPDSEWEVVRVFINGFDQAADDYFMVLTAGVERPSLMSAFCWGTGPLLLHDAGLQDGNPVTPFPLHSPDK